MLCGRCCVTEPPTKLALRLDIFIEILPRNRVNKGMKKGQGMEALALNKSFPRSSSNQQVGGCPSGDRSPTFRSW
jgi:hypothetical protein